MIKIAEKTYGDCCDFYQADMIEYLTNQPSETIDIVTCAWGLGYSKPFRLIHDIYRVLKPGGVIGIIDLTTFSNWRIYWTALGILAEKPEVVNYSAPTHYLSNRNALRWRLLFNHFQIIEIWKGTKQLKFTDAHKLKHQLKNTGSIAVFDSLIHDAYREWFYTRMAQEIQKRFMQNKTISVEHKYIAAIGKKHN
jgi:ubiquinone/menaquinone biosynthesis C-methylase UbiE